MCGDRLRRWWGRRWGRPGRRRSSSSAPPWWAATARVTKGTDLVTLGKSGLKPTLLGLGTGTRGGSEQLAIGQTAFTKMVRHALDRGIRYIDTADQYQTHLFVRLALTGVPRERYFIQTKTRAKNAEVAKADINRFRRELRVDCIDSLLMHCMTKGTWPTDMRPVMDELEKAKERGHVKAIGISCHGFPPLAAAVGCDWCDIQLARINPFGIHMDGKPDKVAAELKKMHAKGRGVIGMKVFQGTDMTGNPFLYLVILCLLGAVQLLSLGLLGEIMTRTYFSARGQKRYVVRREDSPPPSQSSEPVERVEGH